MGNIEEVTAHYKSLRPEGHWFDPSTIQFFKTRFGAVELVGDVYLFVTSEKSPSNPRRYSIRRMDEAGDINCVGAFCQMTRAEVRSAFKRAIKAERLQCFAPKVAL